ncbi:hypothetical protein NDU88_007208 [Pleurodeles waltl]|uniref:Uncharacterized protein n=1 Tax=Pleurodeles waltl TaxID=8319 RepID=A0AAV7SRW0_PLEWA|nr:hypothetical protein NDU88_007208 [Pleurodeles waltl]
MQSDLEVSEEEELNEEAPDEEVPDLAGEGDLSMGSEQEVQEDHIYISREPSVKAGSRYLSPEELENRMADKELQLQFVPIKLEMEER